MKDHRYLLASAEKLCDKQSQRVNRLFIFVCLLLSRFYAVLNAFHLDNLTLIGIIEIKNV